MVNYCGHIILYCHVFFVFFFIYFCSLIKGICKKNVQKIYFVCLNFHLKKRFKIQISTVENLINCTLVAGLWILLQDNVIIIKLKESQQHFPVLELENIYFSSAEYNMLAHFYFVYNAYVCLSIQKASQFVLDRQRFTKIYFSRNDTPLEPI